jgi:hypothetical protein
LGWRLARLKDPGLARGRRRTFVGTAAMRSREVVEGGGSWRAGKRLAGGFGAVGLPGRKWGPREVRRQMRGCGETSGRRTSWRSKIEGRGSRRGRAGKEVSLDSRKAEGRVLGGIILGVGLGAGGEVGSDVEVRDG